MLDVSFPTKMGFEVKSIAGRDFEKSAIPSGVIAANQNVSQAVPRQRKASALERSRYDRNFLWVETHQIRTSRIDAGRMHAEDYNPCLDGVGIQGTTSVARDNSIH